MNKTAAQERPWTDYEKVSLLAEIIKQARVTPGALLKLIVELDVQPRWEDIPLPDGRSLNSSRTAFEEMHKYRTHYQQLPSHYTQPGPLLPGPPPPMSRKRPLTGSELSPAYPALKPKPPGLSPSLYQNPPMEGGQFSQFRHSQGESSEPPRKRRGRPSNAQIEEEKATALAEGRIWQPRPPRAPRKKKPRAEEDTSPTAEPVTAQPAAPQTPDVQMKDAEETSSGKKRRRKPWDDAPAVRPPYDPVRQSTPEEIPAKAGTPPPVQEQAGPAPYQFHATPDPDSGNASSTPKDV